MIRLQEERLFRKLKKKKLDIEVFEFDGEEGPDYIVTYDMDKMRSNVINQAFRSSTLFSNVFYLPNDLVDSLGLRGVLEENKIY